MAPNTSQYIHHLLWYECSLSYENTFNGSQVLPGQCFKGDWLNVLPLCQTISLGIFTVLTTALMIFHLNNNVFSIEFE